MPRLTPPAPAAFTPEQQAVHDHLLETRGALPAPHEIWLHNPGSARHASALGGHFQNHSALPQHLYELAILLVARFWDAEYVVKTHVKRGLEAGLAEDIAFAIRDGREPAFGENQAAEASVFAFATSLQKNHEVSQGVYDDALARLGGNGLVDLTMLIGYITITAATVRVFEIPPRK